MIFVDILGEERVVLHVKKKDNILVELLRTHVSRKTVGLTFVKVTSTHKAVCVYGKGNKDIF